MVMTVLEGRVPPGRVAEVERVFADGLTGMPPEIIETFLVQDPSDPQLFRLHTFWTSREALEAMRRSGVKPRGVQLFEAVGAAPELRVHRVVARGRR